MLRKIARRYLSGRLAAASLAQHRPHSGGMALIVHAFTWSFFVVVPIFVLVALILVLLGDGPVAGGLAFALVALGMVPTGFLMLETLTAVQVWLGGPSQAAALQARLLRRLEALSETSDD